MSSRSVVDGRPVYGMGGLGGLGGRMGGQETSGLDGLGGREPQPCQGEGRGFESRRPLHIRPAQRTFSDGREPFTIARDYTIALSRVTTFTVLVVAGRFERSGTTARNGRLARSRSTGVRARARTHGLA